MNSVLMYSSAIISIFLVGYMLLKNMDIKITLFTTGLILIYIALLVGESIPIKDFKSTGILLIDPLEAVIIQFKSMLTRAGFVILMLGGYANYMNSIGANNVTVSVATKSIKGIKSVYILVPIVFLLGNMLSIVVPSASNLSIILLATLYPVLRQTGMSTLTAGAIIATTATIIPTPLGGDNIAMAQELASNSGYASMSVIDYVINYHAIVSIPTLIFIAVVHYFWQKHCDIHLDKDITSSDDIVLEKIEDPKGSVLYKTVYALLPLSPIILLVASYLSPYSFNMSVEIATIISFIIAIIAELCVHKDIKKVLAQTETFFKGMGNAIPIVVLLVAASIFVLGLRSIGLISSLQDAMSNIRGNNLGFILPLILVVISMIIVFLSGSGVALFYAMIPLILPLAIASGITPFAISIPMALTGNLMRAVSPVAAVVVIVSGSLKISPFKLVKRTSVPMLAGIVFMFILSTILLL